ncbi:MAG: CBS domain-containing protein [Steroidobacteraceae bacterium]|nr:CBS domain-containing protein [Steroidobacteraceae bacterium]
MKINELMTRQVEICSPNDTIQQAARTMAKIDAGVLPVGENDRLVGMITDRDIAVRAVAEGKSPTQCRVRDVMSSEVRYCFEDDDVIEVAENMSEQQIRRLPVVNRDKRLVGIISLADIARQHGPQQAGEALQGIARPGGLHTQH